MGGVTAKEHQVVKKKQEESKDLEKTKTCTMNMPLNDNAPPSSSKNSKGKDKLDSTIEASPIKEKALNKSSDLALSSVPTDKLATSTKTAKEEIQGKSNTDPQLESVNTINKPIRGTYDLSDYTEDVDPFKPRKSLVRNSPMPKPIPPSSDSKISSVTPHATAIKASPTKEKELNNATGAASITSLGSKPTDELATSAKAAQKDIQGKPITTPMSKVDFDAMKPKVAVTLEKDEPKNVSALNLDKPIAIDASSKQNKVPKNLENTSPTEKSTVKEPEGVKSKQEKNKDLEKAGTSTNTKLSRPLNHGPTSALSKNKKEDGNTDSALQVLPIREKELNKATDAASLSSSISVPTDKLATSSETAQKDVQGKPRTAILPESDFHVTKDPSKPKEAPLLKKDEPKNSFPNNVDKQIAKTPIDPSTKH